MDTGICIHILRNSRAHIGCEIARLNIKIRIPPPLPLPSSLLQLDRPLVHIHASSLLTRLLQPYLFLLERDSYLPNTFVSTSQHQPFSALEALSRSFILNTSHHYYVGFCDRNGVKSPS